jgi:membrane protease YdiL (CAAX protease family)
MQISLFRGTQKDRQTTDEDVNHKPPTKRDRLFAILRFFLFAVAIGLFLTGLKIVLSKIPATASLLQQAEVGTTTASITLIIDSIGLLAVIGLSRFVAKIEGRPLTAFGLPLRDAFRKRFALGVIWGLILALLDIGCTYLLGGYTFGSFALSPGKVLSFGAAWALAFIMVGLFEEFLFRGYALHSLTIGVGFWPAAILLSVIFGGLHLTNAGEGIVGALDVMLYGLFACFTLSRTGNLWFAVGLHSAWDFSLTFLYSVPGSGMHAKGQLLQAALHGPAWLTGGAAGPEGSVIGLAVLILSFPVFSALFPIAPAGGGGH